MKRIAGAFSHALISSNHLRTFDVHPRDRPLFTIASANCFTTPWLMLRVCLRVCSGKRKRFLFFSFPFLLFSLPFKARPRKQREWVLPFFLEAGRPKRISEYFQTFVLIALTNRCQQRYCISPYPWNVTLRSVDVTRYTRIFVFTFRKDTYFVINSNGRK